MSNAQYVSIQLERDRLVALLNANTGFTRNALIHGCRIMPTVLLADLTSSLEIGNDHNSIKIGTKLKLN